jgi:hypothetical protein
LFNPFPPSLETQAAFFLSQHGPMIPSDALYVVEGGGQNAREALAAIGGCGGSLACVNGIIQATVTEFVADIKTSLKPQARKISLSGTFRTSGRRPRLSRPALWPQC